MGNIKHNDELLRVHDDGFDVVFNCDNKHQNGVSYHAEKNGKKTKIDPEYAMATLVKKISGGWPADLPVPSAGGYGYTEPEKNVTESEHTFTNIKANKSHVIPTANAFLLEEDQLYDITINGVTYGRCPVHTGPNVNALYCGDLSENMPFEILTGLLPSSKIFGKVTFTTDGDKNFKVEKILGQEIHKINEKYLPEISPTDEVLENAKETGGIGWTKEIKEATTIVDGTFYCAGGNDSVELTNEYILVEGQSYDVTFNGTEYNNLVAFDDGGIISIGGTYGEYNEYPFHIENGENSPHPLVFYTEMPGNYSLVITTIIEEEVIHKIDEKYLPESGGGMMVVNAIRDDDDEDLVVFDKTFEEIHSALPNVAVHLGDSFYKLEFYTDETIEFGYTAFCVAEGAIIGIISNRLHIESDNIVTEFYGEINFRS